MCFRLHFDHTHGLELWSSVLDITNVVEFVLVNSLHFSSSSWGMFILEQSLIIGLSSCNLKGNIVAQSTHTCPSSCATVKAALSPLSWTMAQLCLLHMVPSSARPRVSQFSLGEVGWRQIFSLKKNIIKLVYSSLIVIVQSI